MTRRRLILYIVTGCLVYAVALLAMLPAPWVSHVIESASHHKLLLRDAAGTVWTGSGRLYARQRSGDLIDLGPLRWSTAPSALLQGELAAELEAKNQQDRRQPAVQFIECARFIEKRHDDREIQTLGVLFITRHGEGSV